MKTKNSLFQILFIAVNITAVISAQAQFFTTGGYQGGTHGNIQGVQEYRFIQDQKVKTGQLICLDALTGITTGGGGTYFIVEPNATASLIAGVFVKNLSGTHFQQGSNVHAYIDLSGQFCSNTKTILANDGSPTKEIYSSLSDDKELPFRVFPNPTSGHVFLELFNSAESSVLTIEVFSMIGERLFHAELPQMEQYHLDLSNRQTGLYLIRIVKGNFTALIKVVKI